MQCLWWSHTLPSMDVLDALTAAGDAPDDAMLGLIGLSPSLAIHSPPVQLQRCFFEAATGKAAEAILGCEACRDQEPVCNHGAHLAGNEACKDQASDATAYAHSGAKDDDYKGCPAVGARSGVNNASDEGLVANPEEEPVCNHVNPTHIQLRRCILELMIACDLTVMSVKGLRTR